MSLKFNSNSQKSTLSSIRSSLVGSDEVQGSKFILPLNYGGLGYRFFDQLCIEPDKVLQVDTINNITETKGSVKARGTKLALEMLSRGIGKNDIILISSKTHSHQTIVLLATLFLGGIVCPISPESSYRECVELVKKLKPKMCFCDSRTLSQIERILQVLSITSEIVNFGNEVAGATQFCKLFPYKENTTFKPVFIENPHKEVAFIVPTQGTCNDQPKLVCLSHHNIYLQCLNFMEIFNNPSKVISFFPLSCITQTIVACTSLEFGITRIMAANFNERTACKMIHDFVIDLAILGTELAMRVTGNAAVRDYNLNCLKYVFIGVVNTSKDDFKQMTSTLPDVKFIQVYVLTETGFISAVPSVNYEVASEKPTSVGKILRNCRIKVLSTETKQPVGFNEVGEIYFHGDGLMLGYFKDNRATTAAIEKGYFKTGDLAKYDEEGWIYLEGRIEDIIINQNLTFLPTSIEECITSHPGVHDAVIIGNNLELILCIQKKPEAKLTPGNITMFLSKRYPDMNYGFTQIIFLDEFPRTAAGTVKKRLLREQYLKVKLEYTRSLASINASSQDETGFSISSVPSVGNNG